MAPGAAAADRRRGARGPGERSERLIGSVQAALGGMLATLDRRAVRGDAAAAPAAQAVRSWVESAQATPARSGGAAWMDTVIEAPGSLPDDVVFRVTLAQGFAVLRARLASALGAAGVPPDDAIPLATLVVSAYDGALQHSRMAARVEALRQSGAALVNLIRPYLRGRDAPTYAAPSSQFSSKP